MDLYSEALADVTGAIVSSTSYDSFGNATTSIPTSYQYTGREYDVDTGLYYYRNRWYDPEIGRFMSEDPIEFAGDDINLYGYVWNNPLMYKDFFGLQGHKPKKKPKAAERSAMDNSLQNRLKQKEGPEFQQPENLNPLTANSPADFAKAQVWSGIKGALPGPQGTMGVVAGTIEVAPSLAVTLDALARRNHDIESVTKYAAGESEHPYTEYSDDAPPERFYEDLYVWDRLICNYLWGPCPPSKKDPAVCATRC